MSDPETIESVEFTAPQPPPAGFGHHNPPSVGEVKVTEKFRELLERARTGDLPKLGDVPELPEEVQQLAADLAVVHLPEWRNPAGRVLAEPTVLKVPSSVRLAEYLVERGYVHDPKRERIRWTPTPGGPPGQYDTGLHVRPDENGDWPEPDPEKYWDVDDITVSQLDNGMWVAAHPRGIACEAATKSEAYADLVQKIRAKIKEATDVVDG